MIELFNKAFGRVVVSVSMSRSRAYTSRAHPCLYCYGATALTVFWWACRWRCTQCERSLDVVCLLPML